jgi:hypothetical protein
MNQVVVTEKAYEIMEAVIARGELEQLSPKERGRLYGRTCASLGLNPFTRPFEYIKLNNKLTLYARKDCTDQLRAIHGISVTDLKEREREGIFLVVAYVTDARGRTDVATGAVSIAGLKGEPMANALMKTETKAKRRATLSICGLGFLSGAELGDIPREKIKRSSRDLEISELDADDKVPSILDELEHVDQPAEAEATTDLKTRRLEAEET